MKKLLRAALVTAMIGGVAAIVPSPASAHTSVCVGTGSANTPNLGYPGLYGPVTGGFSFNLNTAGGCVSANLLTGLTAGGTLTGNCGLSFSLSATLTDGGGSHDFNFTAAGSVLLISASVGVGVSSDGTTGTEVTAGGSVTFGVANAVPLPGTPGTPNSNSCASGNANTFQVTGAVLNS